MKKSLQQRILSGLLATVMVASNVNATGYAYESNLELSSTDNSEGGSSNANGGTNNLNSGQGGSTDTGANGSQTGSGQTGTPGSESAGAGSGAGTSDGKGAPNGSAGGGTGTGSNSSQGTANGSANAGNGGSGSGAGEANGTGSSTAGTSGSGVTENPENGGSGLTSGTDNTAADADTGTSGSGKVNANGTGTGDSKDPVDLTELENVAVEFELSDWWILGDNGDKITVSPKETTKNAADATGAASTGDDSSDSADSSGKDDSAAQGQTDSNGEAEETDDSDLLYIYDFSAEDYSPEYQLGFDVNLHINMEDSDHEIQTGDYVTFTLPAEFENLSVETEEEEDAAVWTCQTQEQDSREYKVTLTRKETTDDKELTETLHISFGLEKALEEGEGICFLDVLGKSYKLDLLGVTDEPTTADETNTSIETFKISGSVDINDEDWSELVRPKAFDQPIRVTQTYVVTDADTGESQEVTTTYDTQNSEPGGNFYLKFTHDGNGAGDFEITNVPKKVKGSDGKLHDVTSCTVNIEPTLPYYQATGFTITEEHDKISSSTTVQVSGTLHLNLKTQNLTLQPTIVPTDSSSTTTFPMKVQFKNTVTDKTAVSAWNDSNKKTKTYKPTTGSPVTIAVPIGLTYTVTQDAVDGYRLDTSYQTVTAATGESGSTETKTATSTGSASGTITAGTNVTVTTKNYNQNQTVTFDVEWKDNENANRPELTDANFQLQYKIGDGTWTNLDDTQYAALGIDGTDPSKVPTFDASNKALNQYSYKNLPAADANGNEITYQVVVKEEPANTAKNISYTSSYTDSMDSDGTTGRRKFTFEEQTVFQATISWNDSDKGENDRPQESAVLSKLKLYRRTTGGNYELVKGSLSENDKDVTITENTDGTWSVSITGNARYNGSNQEYDYVLVQGSIDENNTVTQTELNTNYKTYYDNGTGSYANDTVLCHNGGTITEVLYGTVNFRATKTWKDPDGTTDRPTSTVTLWRYTKTSADSIDDAYNNGKAAQVVFQTKDAGGNVKENIVSYNLKGTENTETIEFNSTTVSGLPEGYQFPLYDDHGREYVYFVRETLSGTSADEYAVSYGGTNASSTNAKGTDADETVETKETATLTSGAPNGGTITNTRRKKEAVAITKIWKNPSGLDAIKGVSVQVAIEASADGGETYDELTVYSDTQNSYTVLGGDDKTNAQTITGFSAAVSQKEKVYYVNTCNAEGKAYDMTTARITETVTGADGTTWTKKTANGETTVTDADGNQYTVTTSYTGTSTLANGMQQYRYTQTNTISAKRDYALIKEWDSSISDEAIADIASINFKLERRTTKVNDGSQATFEEVENPATKTYIWTVSSTDVSTTNSRSWKTTYSGLEKYDADGYEYYYRATEVSIVTKSGDVKTLSNYGWATTYYRSLDQTRAVNYKPTGKGRGFITVSKVWQDNGDSERKDVVIRVYKKTQLKAALEAWKEKNTDASDATIVNLDSLTNSTESGKLNCYSTSLMSGSQYTAYVNYAAIDEAIDPNGDKTGTLEDYIVLEYTVGATEGNEKAQPAQYTYAQLYAAASSTDGSYSVSGTVSNASREYKVATAASSDGTVVFTNTRVGQSAINVTKNWEDDQNAEGHRASSIQFQLYRDGVKYTDIPSSVSVQAGLTGEDGEVTEDKNCTVSLDNKTGIVTVTATGNSNNADQWTFTITGLDMFSETGVPYSYNVDELTGETVTSDKADSADTETNAAANDSSDTDGSGAGDTAASRNTVTAASSYTYVQKKTQSDVTEGDGKSQLYSFEFENTITGTTSHTAYKYWKDSGIGTENRPDLYIRVYRYLLDDKIQNPTKTVDELDSYEEYKDAKDPVWTAESEDTSSEAYAADDVHGYNWKITVTDLPQYNDEGKEYVYVFTEGMNNDGKNVFGQYVGTAETRTRGTQSGVQSGDSNEEQTEQADGNVSGTGTAASADTYEVFTNTITGYMTVKGNKTWTGITSYKLGDDDLPDPEITIYRTTDSTITNLQSKTTAEIASMVADNSIIQIGTTKLSGSGKTSYTFPATDSDGKISDADLAALRPAITAGYVCEVNDNGTKKYQLPKFDADGNRYYYLVRETLADTVSSQLYNEINDNGTLSNQFRTDINRRSITVTKKWSRTALDNLTDKDKENKFPSVTFTLYRYVVSSTDSAEDIAKKEGTPIASHTFSAADFKAAEDEKVTYTFDDLLVYSPTGVQYLYYITETGSDGNLIKGYTVTYTDEAGIEAVSGTESNLEGENREGTSSLVGKTIRTGHSTDGSEQTLTITKKLLEALKNNDRIDVISAPENWADKNASNDTAVSTTNDYNQLGTVTLSGTKKWNDCNNFAGLRPNSIKVTLTRRTNDETNQSNKVENTTVTLETKAAVDEKATTPYIVWSYGMDADGNSKTAETSDEWSYTIYNLPRYAANGMPYIYTLSEEQVSGYKKAYDVTTNGKKVTEKENSPASVAVGAMVNQYDGSFTVTKTWQDGYNKYNLRPKNVTVKLQRRAKSTSTENAAWGEWEDITLNENQVGTYDEKTGTWSGGYPSVLKDSSGNSSIISINLTAANVKANTMDSTWAYTFTNLPTIGKTSGDQTVKYEYRCVETAIGGVELKGQSTTSDQGVTTTKYVAAGYERTKEVTAEHGTSTAIENTLDSGTSLVVTKTWEGDQDDLYQLRPDKITFVLQKKKVAAGAESATGTWETVTNADGSDYTFTIGKADNWTKTLTDLPMTEVVTNDDGTTTTYTLSFRAVEVHADAAKDETGKITDYTTDSSAVSGAQSYQDTTNYGERTTADTSIDSNGYYDKTEKCYKSSITNKLREDNPSKTITVTKKWAVDDDTTKSATFELLYRKKGSDASGTAKDSGWHCYRDSYKDSEAYAKAAIAEDKLSAEDWSQHTGEETATGHCLLKTATTEGSGAGNGNGVSSGSNGIITATVSWTNLPMYDSDGDELEYKVIEHPVDGCTTAEGTVTESEAELTDGVKVKTYAYTFTNIQTQNYTVQKIWQNESYAEKASDGTFKAEFKLQRKLGTDGEWTDVAEVLKSASTEGTASGSAEAAAYADVKSAGKAGYSNITLSTKTANDASEKGTWENLPRYVLVNVDGTETRTPITYRAVEVNINGVAVETVTSNGKEIDTNGAYVATYAYSGSNAAGNGNTNEANTIGNTAEPTFGDTATTVTNRMIYGFVNLSKKAAYLSPQVQETKKTQQAGTGESTSGGTSSTETVSLAGVTFDIYKVENGKETLYVSGVTTDANGNLQNTNGRYGSTENGNTAKYLVAGTYVLKETSTKSGYSVWNKGVTFKVGSGEANVTGTLSDTGEHGTAWISTLGVGGLTLTLKAEYHAATEPSEGHFIATASETDGCVAWNGTTNTGTTSADPAVNLESRGVVSFTKTGESSATDGTTTYAALDTHTGATGENAAYFGVYRDSSCTTQVAGMVPKKDKSGNLTSTMVLTDKALNGDTLNASDSNAIPYLRTWTGGDNDIYPFTILSGTYYIKELRAPAGYKLDDTVRKLVVSTLETPITEDASTSGSGSESTGTTDLSTFYTSNKGVITLASGDGGTQTENTVSKTNTNAANTAGTYQWSNTPTKVTLYKLDQFGQQVTLAGTGKTDGTTDSTGSDTSDASRATDYLELTIQDEGNTNTFPCGTVSADGTSAGTKTIRLYQNTAKPATNGDGTGDLSSYVTYTAPSDANGQKGYWTITGLLEAGKTYTLSEPESSVAEGYKIAQSISFTLNADGTIAVADQSSDSADSSTAGSTESSDAGNEGGKTDETNTIIKKDSTAAALTANGQIDDYKNCYVASADGNTIVMRDASERWKNVALKKVNSSNSQPIKDISFKLYQYDASVNEETGEVAGWRAVLADDVYLTTGEDGRIELFNLGSSITNQLTGKPLNFGLKAGKYYFEEVEGGASYGYKLVGRIYFEITEQKVTEETDHTSYDSYATVTYDISGTQDQSADSNHLSVDSQDPKTVIVKNDPFETTITLHKYDASNRKTAIPGTQFTLYRTVDEKSTLYTEAEMVEAAAAEEQGSTDAAQNNAQAAAGTGSEQQNTGDTAETLWTRNETGIFTTDSEGNIRIRLHEKGTYTLKETKAASGYQCNASVTFRVNDDGSVTIISGGTLDTDENGEEIKTTILVKNDRIPESSGSTGYWEDTAGAADTATVPVKKKKAQTQTTDAAAGSTEETGTAASEDENSSGLVNNAKRTGDAQTPLIWIGLIAGAVVLIAAIEWLDRRRRRK